MTKDNGATKPAAINLFELQPTTLTHELLHPGTGEPTGLELDLVSMDDERLVALTRKMDDRRLKLSQRGKPVPAEELEEHGIALISTAIVNWRWLPHAIIDFNGERPAYTPGMAKNIVSRAVWVRRQLDDILGDTSRFFQR